MAKGSTPPVSQCRPSQRFHVTNQWLVFLQLKLESTEQPMESTILQDHAW